MFCFMKQDYKDNQNVTKLNGWYLILRWDLFNKKMDWSFCPMDSTHFNFLASSILQAIIVFFKKCKL